jgi:hypothetical protein
MLASLYGGAKTPSGDANVPSPINLVGEPGSFKFSSPIGPKEGPPNLMNLPPSMGGTNLKAGFIPQPSTPPNLMGLPPQMGGTNLEAGFMAQPSASPNLLNLPTSMGGVKNRFSTPANTIKVQESSNFRTPPNAGDMSGDPFFQSVYNPNALKFSNPYNINRGFMDDYDAVPGPNGEIIFKPR